MSWISNDGLHQGRAVLVDVFGCPVDLPLEQAAERPDAEELRVRAVCDTDGWHTDFADTIWTHPLVRRTDGTIDAEASQAPARREWELHSGEAVRRLLATLRSLPTDQRLAALHAAEQAVAAEIEVAVAAARAEKKGWGPIGELFGVSRQVATWRWKKLEQPEDGGTP